MADDKRDGDDLFEDLDKFFAPIKDVEFGEPASAGALETPSEEHVSLKANEPAPTPSSEPAVEATSGDGARLFADRYALVRLEDLSADPGGQLERIYELTGRAPPDPVVDWARAHISRVPDVHLADDPRWARAARLIAIEPELEQAGYSEVLELDAGETPLDLTPPPARSRLSGFMGRARRRSRRLGGRVDR